MELWTLQHRDLDIHHGVYDPTKSEYLVSFHDYGVARQEVAQHLGREIDKFIWASSECRFAAGCITYRLNVPHTDILAVIDGYLWNLRFGNRRMPAPPSFIDEWKKEAESLYPQDGPARQQHKKRKLQEWQDRPLPASWWSLAKEIGLTSENPQFLLPYPIPKAWEVERVD